MDNTSSAYDNLLENIQTAIAPPTETGSTYLCRGPFKYFHYKCEGFNDVGWGCAYRTLQSICSLIIAEQNPNDELQCVPTIPQIQETLVSISDKPQSFLGSREWIGALEVFYVIDTLYNISCKIQHVPKTEDLKKYANVVKKYFEDWGGLIMMGGDVDASSKGIAGVHIAGNEAYFLVVDPHFVGKPKSAQELIDKGYLQWRRTGDFVDSSFYNLCLPQFKVRSCI